jgi:hypothetical protein
LGRAGDIDKFNPEAFVTLAPPVALTGLKLNVVFAVLELLSISVAVVILGT